MGLNNDTGSSPWLLGCCFYLVFCVCLFVFFFEEEEEEEELLTVVALNQGFGAP
jgi:hypothetical protein